ncbi:MAG: MFS transporter [Thermoguttaceae bacterium]|nr:MFS transporter [Thermoguttaceae bacterium]
MSQKPPGYRWELLLLLSLAFFLHQADRAIFGVLLEPIQKSLALTSEQMGLTGTVLFAMLALMMPIAGFVGDRFSKKWIIVCSVIFWSCSTAVTGWAAGLFALIFFRSIATAGGESFYAPAAYPMLAAYHKKTRSLAFSVHQAALYIGVMSSGFIAGALSEALGWRAAFMIFGGAGVILGGILIFRLRPMPVEDSLISEESSGQKKESVSFGRASLQIVRIPTFWFLTAGFSAVVAVNNAYLIWAPTFVKEQFGTSLTAAGGGTMLYHHLLAFVGILIGGFLTDRLITRACRFRLLLQMFALALGFPFIYLMGGASSLTMVWITSAAFGFFRGLYETNTHAALFDVIPTRIRSTAVALMTLIAFLIGSCTPWLLGFYRSKMGESGLAFGFQSLAFVYLLGAFFVFMAFLFTFKKDRIVEQ